MRRGNRYSIRCERLSRIPQCAGGAVISRSSKKLPLDKSRKVRYPVKQFTAASQRDQTWDPARRQPHMAIDTMTGRKHPLNACREPPFAVRRCGGGARHWPLSIPAERSPKGKPLSRRMGTRFSQLWERPLGGNGFPHRYQRGGIARSRKRTDARKASVKKSGTAEALAFVSLSGDESFFSRRFP